MEKIEDYSQLTLLEIELLLIKKKLRESELFNQEHIKHYAQIVVEHFEMQMTPKEEQDCIRRLLNLQFNTYQALGIDMSSYVKDVRELRNNSIDDTLINAMEGTNTLQYLISQNIELLKELLIVWGYAEEMTDAVSRRQHKFSEGNYFPFFFNYLRKLIKIEKDKQDVICGLLIEQAEKQGTRIKDIEIHLDPMLGYDINQGVTNEYSHFRQQLDKTSEVFYKAGKKLALERLYVLNRINFEPIGIV